MVVNKLSVQNIRSHKKFETVLSPTVTVITGLNGSGKTSLLEALYLALQGNSFRGSDSDILRHKSKWWRIDIETDNLIKRSVTFNPLLETKRKKIVVDDKIMYRLLPKYKHPIILFEPDDLRLLHGSPARRRQFIDNLISQLDILYSVAVRKYERALRQRNNLLKQNNGSNNELFVWNVALSEYGSYIIEKRIAFIEMINNQLNDTYNSIAESSDNISVHYSHTYIGDIKQKLLNDLHNHNDRDLILGFTSTGPHRHDIIFQFNSLPALEVASRGEVRSIVLAIKFIEVGIVEQITNIKPLILLDDVFSELDELRQKHIMNNRKGQIIITSAHIPKSIKNYYSININH
ncbi:MAG TPA: DNA replication and repair protein RecF [Candidatus Saccharibacteria bacterium]|nr:DNA replication and repair protein RecF [Candidatus Saccharibacteria bacterium]